MNGRTPQQNSISDLLSALQRLATATSGYYWSEAMNPTIRLGTFQAQLKAGGIRDKRPAVASLVCEPSPRIVYEALEASAEFFFAAFEHGDTVAVPHLEEVPDRPHPRRCTHRNGDVGLIKPDLWSRPRARPAPAALEPRPIETE